MRWLVMENDSCDTDLAHWQKNLQALNVNKHLVNMNWREFDVGYALKRNDLLMPYNHVVGIWNMEKWWPMLDDVDHCVKLF